MDRGGAGRRSFRGSNMRGDSFGNSRRGPSPAPQPQPPPQLEAEPMVAEPSVKEEGDHPHSSKIVTDPLGSAETLRDYPNFIQNISHFFNQESLSDVTLKVGDTIYPAHKFVLAKSSDVFRTMLYERNWIKQGAASEVELNESEVCQSVFDVFLRYLYTAEVNICTDTAVGILCLADKYNEASLKDLCTQYMIEHSKSPRVGNALQWYAWSKALHLPALFDRCFECICWNLYDIITSDDWLSMDVDFVHDILKSSKLVIPDEFTLFEYVMNWLLHPSRDGLYDNALMLLPLIRFPQMLVAQLNKIEHFEISNNEDCGDLIKDLINKAYRFRALCPSQHELGINFKDDFYQPRDYCYQIVDNIRMANSLRFGIQVDVKMFVGPVPKEDRTGDWKITYRKNGDVWSLQIYCQESAMIQNEARFQATVMVSNEEEKVIQVQRANEFVCSRGNHQNVQVTIEDPGSARSLSVIIKPTAN